MYGDLVVSLMPPAVSVVRTAELNQPGDRDSGPRGIVGAKNSLPAGNLNPQVPYRLGIEYRG
jgi:hypothetical protein